MLGVRLMHSGIYQKELKTGTCTDLYTHVRGSIIHNSQKVESTPRPSADEWINMWYIHTLEYYSLRKRIDIVIHACNSKLIFFFFCFLGVHLQHREVPRLGFESEL